MENFCSIFHARFKNLISVIPSASKAQLMDYILLGWQTSTYRLKNSDKKWFMKPYSEITAETGIPNSTLGRYIKELCEAGFLERRQALYSRTTEQGGFEVRKGNYIYVTEQFLDLLKKPKETAAKDSVQQQENNQGKELHSSNSTLSDSRVSQLKGTNFGKNEIIEPLISRGLYISDLYTSLSNTISFTKTPYAVDNKITPRLEKQFDSIKAFFDKEVKEEIPDEVKKLVLGTFFNLSFETGIQFSQPKQIAAEYLYALVNVAFYLPEVKCFKNRNNILSKIIRENRWRTPKGFYKYFYLGQVFKDKQEIQEQQWQAQKEEEIRNARNGFDTIYRDKRLVELETQMFEKSTLIDKLMSNIYEQSDEEIILGIREKIRLLKEELEHLWQKQSSIEQEIEEHQLLSKLKDCA